MTVDPTEGVEPATAVVADEASASPADQANGDASLNGEAAQGEAAAQSAEATADNADAAPLAAEDTENTSSATGTGADTADVPASASLADAPSADADAALDSTDAPAPMAEESASNSADVPAPEASASDSADDSAADASTTTSGDAPPSGTDASDSTDVSAANASTHDTADAPTADGSSAVSVDDTADVSTADETSVISADDTADAPAAVDEEDAAPVVDTRPEPTTMEELLAEQSTEIRSLKHGDVVEGNVVRIDKDEILVDIGAKSEGVVSNRELYGRNAESQPALNIGDTVLVYVLQPESNEGHAVLSLRRAGLERKWRSMQEQLDAGVIIEAPVIDHNKGGLIVDCGIRGFVPISQIVDFPRRPQNEQPRDAAQEIAEKLQPYVGRKLRLKILEVNRKANRLILSEKVALYEERREKRDELFSSLKVGQQVKGTVRSIAPFGVFVDLGGIDGLVHKSELSWNKVNNPESGYRVGEEVEAEVIDINHERGRISLSIRRLQPDPWHSTVADLGVGDVIEGTVTKIVNFGAFVRVREGLEGLIHISELSQQRVAHPGDVVHEGQKLNLKVISLDSERHRLGLSLKQAEETAAPVRPATEGASSAVPRERSERPSRGRSERSGYDASQAVQEPEGGIDNTLAAAFAQVRQQMAAQESAASDDESGSQAATDDAMAVSPEESSASDAEAPTPAAADTSDAEATATDEVVPAQDLPAADASAGSEEASAPDADTTNQLDAQETTPAPADTSDAEAMATDEVVQAEELPNPPAEVTSDNGGSDTDTADQTAEGDAITPAPAETSDAEATATDEVVQPDETAAGGSEVAAASDEAATDPTTTEDASSTKDDSSDEEASAG